MLLRDSTIPLDIVFNFYLLDKLCSNLTGHVPIPFTNRLFDKESYRAGALERFYE